MKDKIVNGMQIFARSIVTPILFLPIVGILLAIVGVISNPSIVGEGSPLINVGEFVGGGLWTFLTNLSIIFCVGIAMGMAKEKKAEAALVSVFSFLFFLGANHAWLSLTGKLINLGLDFVRLLNNNYFKSKQWNNGTELINLQIYLTFDRINMFDIF